MAPNRSVPSTGGADDLATAVLTASRVLIGISARSLAGVEDSLTLTQFRTLVVLQGHGGCTLRVLADGLGVNASSAMRTVDRLVTADLVVRRGNPDDRREVRLELTAAGADLVRTVTLLRRRRIATIVRRMPAEHQAWLVAALQSFAQAAGEVPVAADHW